MVPDPDSEPRLNKPLAFALMIPLLKMYAVLALTAERLLNRSVPLPCTVIVPVYAELSPLHVCVLDEITVSGPLPVRFPAHVRLPPTFCSVPPDRTLIGLLSNTLTLKVPPLREMVIPLL